MEVNLSYNTLCGLRDCVSAALRVSVEWGDKVLTLPTDDDEMEIDILEEYLDMLDELIENAQ